MADETSNVMEEQKKNCPFCKILKGEIPSKKIFENKKHNAQIVGILDINPAVEGHALIMPKEHYPIMPLLPQETADELFIDSVRIAEIERNLFQKEGSTIFIANGAAAGQQSSHFMVHVLAHNSSDLTNFSYTPKKADDEKYNELHKILNHNLNIMLKKAYSRYPMLNDQGKPISNNKFSKEKVIQIIDSNDQLKQAIISQPSEFLLAIPTNNQLKELFVEVDPKEIIKHYIPDWNEEIQKYNKQNNKQSIEENQNLLEKTDTKENSNKKISIIDQNDLINYIKNNKELLNFIVNNTNEFKAQLPNSEKMKFLFKDANIDEIISILKQENQDNLQDSNKNINQNNNQNNNHNNNHNNNQNNNHNNNQNNNHNNNQQNIDNMNNDDNNKENKNNLDVISGLFK
jgi:diadenosine tetraphosphate (Ap4A) HIT family hydrolase